MKPAIKRPPIVNLTQSGLEQAQHKIELLTKERAEVLVRLQAAREMGDLSENGAYKAARWELGGIDRELRRLNYLVTYAKVIESKKYKLEFNGKPVEYTLVSKHESNPAKGLISYESPLGQLLKTARPGDTVTLERDNQKFIYLVKAIQ